MESAGRVIGKLNRATQVMTNEELARAAWPQAVGIKVASHTAAVALVRKRLVVEVEDMTWQRQLNALRYQLVANLAAMIGSSVVEDLEFRPMTPRRQAQRAGAARSSPSLFDDADGIADPQLRRIYKIIRKKASA